MMLLVSFSLSLLLIPDPVSSVGAQTWPETVRVVLGQDLVLNCTYNCSSGFIKGCWVQGGLKRGLTLEGHQDAHCPSITNLQGDLCTLSRTLSSVTVNDTRYNYTCVTVDKGQANLPRRTERVVQLQLPQDTSDLSGQMVSSPAVTTAASDVSKTTMVKKEPDEDQESTGVKVLATVSVVVAVVLTALAAHLCLSRGRGPKGNPAFTSLKTSSENTRVVRPTATGPSSAVTERVALRITPPDDQSDHEVPYADIMISVRGSSTPELTTASYLTTGDHRDCWREEAGPGLHPRANLQACRSADRLHPYPREVNRKMSTSSEYAVITYS
ncbi:uncharacterized protein LOC134029171 [Osmerus eperlanus]|uniref:uncharacterized protein LOC134029171 n=1 Tax=Osmerus eperlanus TaxID=29151 RepID=UPI002E14F388